MKPNGADDTTAPASPSIDDNSRVVPANPARAPVETNSDPLSPDNPTRTRQRTYNPGAPTWDDISVATQLRDPKRYHIICEHGRGGLGRVSRAHDVELGRDVAIKELIAPNHVSEVRFLREALITARLEHPGIVPVHEAGRWPDGTPFYSMKLVAGRSLRELIAERTTVDQRIGLLHHVIAVADAIAYAHGRNVIHRDLKPANVIVGAFGETIVIDWGLAKDLTSAEESTLGGGPFRAHQDDGLTSAGTILGTPAYMPPEQARGEPVDQRADVFAIGAMLWELCSLEKLPPAYTGQRRRILRRSGIDQDLVTITDKAVHPDPEYRYPDASALAADLKAFKTGARIAARRYSLWALLAHWTRRHRTMALVGVCAALAMLVGAAIYVNDISVERGRADAAFRQVKATNDVLTLEHAELQLHTDPTAASSTLSGYHGVDDSRRQRLLAEARGRGVATAVLALHNHTVRFLAGNAKDNFISLSEDGRILLTRQTSSTTLASDVSAAVLVDYSPATRSLAYATSPSGVALLQLTTVTSTRLSSIQPQVLRFNPSGTRLASVDKNGSLTVWTFGAHPGVVQYPRSFPGAFRMRFMTDTRLLIQDPAGLHVFSIEQAKDAPINMQIPPIATVDANASTVAIGALNGELILLSVDLRIIGRLQLCHQGVSAIEFVSDTENLAFGCRDGNSGLLNFERSEGKLTILTTFPTQGLTVVKAAPKGRYITVLDQSRTAYIYDTQTRLIYCYSGNAGQPTYVAAPTPEFPHVVVGDANGTVRVWDAPSTSARLVLHGPTSLFEISFAPDSQAIVVNGAERIARYMDIRYGKTAELRGHTAGVIRSRISPDGRSILTYSYDGTIRVWGAKDFKTIREFREHKGVVQEAEYLEDGTHVASIGDDGRLLVWAIDHDETTPAFQQNQPLTNLEVLSHNRHLVVTDLNGSAWEVSVPGIARQFRTADGDDIKVLRAARNGDLLALGTASGRVVIYTVSDWHVLLTLETKGTIRQIAFDPMSRDLLIASEAGREHTGRVLFVPLNSQRIYRWSQIAMAARDAAYTPDGEILGFTCDDGGTWFYRIRDDKWVYVNDHNSDTLAGVFSPDGRLFASVDQEGRAVIRDVTTTIN